MLRVGTLYDSIQDELEAYRTNGVMFAEFSAKLAKRAVREENVTDDHVIMCAKFRTLGQVAVAMERIAVDDGMKRSDGYTELCDTLDSIDGLEPRSWPWCNGHVVCGLNGYKIVLNVCKYFSNK